LAFQAIGPGLNENFVAVGAYGESDRRGLALIPVLADRRDVDELARGQHLHVALRDFRVRLQQRLLKTRGRLINHARYYWLLPAESHLTRRPFGGMLRKIVPLPVPAG